jgi:hypothetical protein
MINWNATQQTIRQLEFFDRIVKPLALLLSIEMGVSLPCRFHALVAPEVLCLAAVALVDLPDHPPSGPVGLKIALIDIDPGGLGEPLQHRSSAVSSERRRSDVVLLQYPVDAPEFLDERVDIVQLVASHRSLRGWCEVANTGQSSLAGRWTFFNTRSGRSAGEGIGAVSQD